MCTANSQRQSIGRIFGFREFGEPKKVLNHPLDLFFTCLAISHNGHLRLFWSILEKGNFVLGCS